MREYKDGTIEILSKLFCPTMSTSSNRTSCVNSFRLVNSFMCPITLILHCLGTFLISCLIHEGSYKIQHLLLLNYSLSIIWACSLNTIGSLVHKYAHETKRHLFFQVGMYIFYYILFCAFIFINLDRLLEVLLNIKYPQYITNRRIVVLIVFSWCFVACAIAPFSTIFRESLYIDIASSIDICYLVFVTISWTVIFYHFKRSRTHPTMMKISTTISIGATFRKSRFFLPLLLVLSFVSCTIVPDIVLLMNGGVYTVCILLLVNTGFYIESTVDAVLYINMDREIKRILWRKLGINRIRQINPRGRRSTRISGLWRSNATF